MNEEEIFHEALGRNGAEERAAYLEHACAGNGKLQASVEALLRANVGASGFMDVAAPGPVATLEHPVTERPGTLIGPYKLLEQIGEGGMGLVYVAEQQKPVRRKVALKIIKPGMDSRQVIARFEAERQALALMDHPNIARILDAGTTGEKREESGVRNQEAEISKGDSSLLIPHSSLLTPIFGRPYFVMELVKGKPITEYCDGNKLKTRQRLELFLDVCHAVQHAHQKGIIHRDLKPSNILVEVHDVRPVVKIIDFGIAKAMGQQLCDRTLYTGIAQMIGTPLYMSPEQAGLSSLDVDTRSDVYALGVLLYELLTGTTPFDSETLKKAGYDEMRRIIRDDEPAKPSTRLSTLHQEALSTIAEQRGLEPRKLSQQIRGELDWIVMKALEKDRNRRYESASTFGADVQRYLQDEPVQACPPSAGYRAGKFLRRHRAAVLTATALLVLGAGVGWVALDQAAQRVEKEHERFAKAQAAQEDLNAAEIWKKQKQWAKALQALARASVRLDEGESGPLIIQLEQQRREMAIITDAALRMNIDLTPSTPEAFCNLGQLLINQRQFGEAEEICRKAIALKPDYAPAYNKLGLALYSQNRLPEAEDSYRKAINLNPDMVLESQAYNNLGHCLRGLNRLTEAVAAFRKAIELNPKNALYHVNFGVILYFQQKLPEAEAAFAKAIELKPDYAGAYHDLGNVLYLQRKLSKAEEAARKAIEFQPNYPNAYNTLGIILRSQQKLSEAAAAQTEAIKQDNATADANLGCLLMGQGQFEEALAAFRRARELGWQHSSAELVLWAERWLQLDARLPGVLAGEKLPADAAEVLGLAEICQLRCRQYYVTSVRLYREAFAADPALVRELRADVRYDAACAAAQAGCGKGKDAGNLDPDEYAGLRDQALAWLRAELDGWRSELATEPIKARNGVQYEMQQWRRESALSGVRDDDGLAKLPEAERQKWRTFWSAAGNLRRNTTPVEVLLDTKLQMTLNGDIKTADPAELVALAKSCSKPNSQLYATSARLYKEAFAAAPELVRNPPDARFRAAVAAALAGSGQGNDAASLDAGELAVLRGYALKWLREELANYWKGFELDPDYHNPRIVVFTRDWQHRPEFKGVRDADALTQLPDTEHRQWQAFWEEVAELEKRAAAPPPQ